MYKKTLIFNTSSSVFVKIYHFNNALGENRVINNLNYPYMTDQS